MNRLVPVPVPAAVVTTISLTPAVPTGVTALMLVSLSTVKLVAAVPPIVTPLAPVKPVPVMVTAVPPSVEPVAGVMPVTVGATAGTT